MEQSEISLLVTATDKATGVLGGVGTALQNFGSRATALGQSLLPISVGAGIVAGSALKMAADYEQSMNILQATSGATAAEMAALDAKALELGADITLPGTSAKDAAEAMLELSKAGLSVTDVMAASQGVLQMSAAAQISNAEAATITANALNMFGLAGSDATMVADLLAAGANSSSASVQDMAASLQMSGAVAAMSGMSIQDTATAIALMANAGLQGSDAGTSLKTMLLALQSPTAGATAAMQAMGISIFDASGNMLPMPAIIGQFSGALGGMTQQQQAAALSTIFGTDAIRAANIILGEGTGAWNTMSAAVTEGGAAASLAAAQNAGLKGAVDGLKSALETAALAGARPLLEALTPLVTKVSEAIGAFAAANPQIVQAGVAFAAVLAVAAPVALGLGVVATALGALLSPVGAVILIVAALAAAWVADFGNIRSTTETVMAAVQSVVTSVMSAVQSFIASAMAATSGIWQSTWNTIKSMTDSVLASIKSIVTSVLSAVQSFIAAHGADIRATLIGAWQTISQIINTVVQIISTVVTSVFGAIATFLANHKTEIVAVLTAAWNLIKTVIQTALAVIQTVVNTVLAVIQGDWKTAWEGVETLAETVWDGIHQIILDALQLILSLVGTNLTGVKNWFVNIWNEITGFLQGVVGQMVDIGRNIVQGLINGISGMKDALMAKAREIFQGLPAWARKLLGEHSPSTVFREIGVDAMLGLALGLSDTRPTLDALAGHIGTIVSYLEYLANSVIAPAAVASAKAITDPLKDIFSNVAGILGGLDAFMSFRPGTDTQGVVYIIDRVATTVQQVLNAFAHLAGIVDGAKVWSSKAFTDPLKVIFDNVKSIVEGATALAEFAGREIKGDVSGAIQQIGVIVRDMVLALSDAALHVADLGGVAKIFAENAAPVLGIVQDGLDALTAMGDWKAVDWGPVGDGISQLTIFLQKLVGWIGFAGRLVETELQESARAFAENAGPVIGLVEDGLSALAAMGNWKVIDWGPVSAALPQLTTFLEKSVGWMGLAGRLVGTELAGAAATFAESAKPVVDIVSGGLESLAALGAWDRRVNFTEIDAAVQRLSQFIETLVGWFSYQAEKLSEDAMSAAKAFAEAAGPVVGVVEGGLKSLAALGAWDRIVNFTDLDTAMQRLSLSIEMLIGWFSYQAGKLEEGALGAAKAFAEAGSAVVGTVKTAIDAFGALGDFVAPPRDILDQFIEDMTYLVEQIGEAAGTFTDDGMAQAKAFGEAAGAVAEMVNAGVKGLIGEDGVMYYHSVAHETIDLFIADMKYILEELITLSDLYASDVLDVASSLANTMADIGTALNKGVAGLIKPQGTKTETVTIADYTGISHDTIDLFLADMEYIVGKVGEAAAAFTERGLALALAFAESGKSIFDAIAKGVKAAVGISDTGAEDVDQFRASMETIVTIIRDALATIDGLLISMVTGAYSYGASFTSNLAAGILSTMPELQAAVAQIGAALSQAGSGGLPAASSGPAPGANGAAATATTTVNNSVTLVSPVVREDVDIQKIADAVSASLSSKASTYTRMAVA